MLTCMSEHYLNYMPLGRRRSYRGQAMVIKAVDWWSLGTLMFDMLTGAVSLLCCIPCLPLCVSMCLSLSLFGHCIHYVCHRVIVALVCKFYCRSAPPCGDPWAMAIRQLTLMTVTKLDSVCQAQDAT